MKDFEIKNFRVDGPSKKLRVSAFPTVLKSAYKNKEDYLAKLSKYKEKLAVLQDLLYAENSSAMLLTFQGMDTAGKDGAIKHVMSGLNPQGCQVYSFKRPSDEELDHDYLWRHIKALPEHGRLGVWNRSHYEEVLVVRVHPELLKLRGIKEKPNEEFWDRRLNQLRVWEGIQTDNKTKIIKFYLHISNEEQAKRLIKRAHDPEKNWKFAISDLKERECWDKYQAAYQEVLRSTGNKNAPWYIIPSDDKKAARLLISEIIIDEMQKLRLQTPKLSKAEKAELLKIAAKLEKELQKKKPPQKSI